MLDQGLIAVLLCSLFQVIELGFTYLCLHVVLVRHNLVCKL